MQQALKPHEYTKQVITKKGSYHKCFMVPDTMFSFCFAMVYGEGPRKIYFLNFSTN